MHVGESLGYVFNLRTLKIRTAETFGYVYRTIWPVGDNVRAGQRRFNSARRVPLLLCDAKGTAIPLSISCITPAELIAAACWFYSNRFLKYSAICAGG